MNKPRWTGKIAELNVRGYVFLYVQFQGPLLVQINGCEDYFLPIFSTPEKLHDHVLYLKRRSNGQYGGGIKQIVDPIEFINSMLDNNVRIMVDPIVINDDCTRWKEIMRDGDALQMVAESN